MPKQRNNISRLNFLTRNRILLSAGLLLILIVALEVSGTTHFIHEEPTPAVIKERPAGSDNNSDAQGTTHSPSNTTPSLKDTKSGDTSNSNSGDANLPLYTPYGDFVSNHHPGKNGSPTSEVSVCNTTPSATCYIKFTKGDVSTSLPAKETNGDGAATWYWDTKTAKLSAGEWKISAVATLSGEIKSSNDPLALTVE